MQNDEKIKQSKNISNILLYKTMLPLYSKCRKTQSVKGILLLICEICGSKKFIRSKKQACISSKLKFKTLLSKILVLGDTLF